MIKRTCISNAVAAAFLAMSVQLAFAVDEAEPAGTRGVNDSLGTAQQLTVGTDGKIIVQGSIGVTDPALPAIPDVDFYWFEGFANNSVSVDIDDGIKAVVTPTTRHVDTIVALYGPGATPGTWEILLQNDTPLSIDEGSAPIGGERDARLDLVTLPADGTYIVGVSSSPRFLRNDGSTTNATVTPPNARFPNGSYTLIVSGVTPPPRMQYVRIDIKPGDPDEVTRLNAKMKRDIPIALLSNAATASSPAFDALQVKVNSITFGRGGEEKSLVRCHKHGKDVNRDGLPDLICLFDVPSAAFEEDDLVGKMKGESANGLRFEAAAKLKVKAPRKKYKDKDDDRHHGKHHGRDHDRDDDDD